MGAGGDNKRNRKNGLILGLLRNCMIRKYVGNCPLQNLVALSLDEQIEMVEALSTDDRERIFAHHQGCSSRHLRVL